VSFNDLILVEWEFFQCIDFLPICLINLLDYSNNTSHAPYRAITLTHSTI
jgi:hypothetical protein